jgi:quercetin dioxygenase-like cupin family protein
MLHLRTIITRPALAALLASGIVAPAIATQGSNITVTNVVNGHFGTLDIKTENNKVGRWGMILKTKDDTDVGTDSLTLGGGGSTGWHNHPAAVMVTVVEGSINWYNGSNAMCPPTTYSAGQSFVEEALVIHNVINASMGNQAKFIAIRINPTGVPFRIDQPKPGTCP